MNVIELIENNGFIPIVDTKSLQTLIDAQTALSKAGIDVLEVRSDNINPDVMQKFCEMLKDVVVGVGGVTDAEQAESYKMAGAKYIAAIEPDETFLRNCIEKDVFIIPDCRTKDKIEHFADMGINTLRYVYTGPVDLDELDDIGDRFPDIKLILQTADEPGSIKSYSGRSYITALAGKWIYSSDMAADERYEEITQKAAAMMRELLNFRIAHVGINADNETQARDISGVFSKILDMSAEEEATSFFVSSLIEVNKTPGRGEHGHIGILAPNIKRAVYHIQKRGYEIDITPLIDGVRGPLYLHTEVGGFAIHLVQKG